MPPFKLPSRSSPRPSPSSPRGGHRQTHAIGALTARITAKIGRRQPAKKILSTIQNNWTRIAPKGFLDHAKPTQVSQAPNNTTLTLVVTQAFAPIALHRTTQLLNNINAFLGSDTVQSVKLKQTPRQEL